MIYTNNYQVLFNYLRSMKLSNEQAARALEEIQTTWDALLQNTKNASQELDDTFKRIHQSILRQIHQFGSGQTILVTAGMLKSGKSTLVNLLARNKNLSPIGYGVDTTRRPVLIREPDKDPQYAQTGVIEIYDAPVITEGENAKRERDKRIQLIIDKIRGLETEQTIKPRLVELNDKNLKFALCTPPNNSNGVLQGEPLLIVVRPGLSQNESDKSPLLSEEGGEGVLGYIFDMPGLDSTNASVAVNTDDYSAFIRESDMLLFIQSTVAPLNKQAVEVLKKIRDQIPQAAFRVIQNFIDGKYWIHDDYKKKDINRQLETTKQEIRNLLGEPIEPAVVNLGKAYDGLFTNSNHLQEDAQKLISESGYLEEEQQLCSMLKSCGEKLRLDACTKRLAYAVQENKKELGRERDGCSRKIEAIKKTMKHWANIRKNLETQLDLRLAGISRRFILSDSMKDKLNNCIDEVIDECSQENYKKLGEAKVKTSDINEFLAVCSKRSLDKINQILKSCNLENLIVQMDEVSSNAVQLVKDHLDKICERINEKMEPENEQHTMYQQLFPNKISIPFRSDQFQFDSLNLSLVEWRFTKYEQEYYLPWIFFHCFEKKRKINRENPDWMKDLQLMRNEYIQQIENKMNTQIKDWINSRVSAVLHQFFDGRIQQTIEFEKQENVALESITHDQKCIDDYDGALDKISASLTKI